MIVNGVAVLWILAAVWTSADHQTAVSLQALAFPSEDTCHQALREQWTVTHADGMKCFRVELDIGPG